MFNGFKLEFGAIYFEFFLAFSNIAGHKFYTIE